MKPSGISLCLTGEEEDNDQLIAFLSLFGGGHVDNEVISFLCSLIEENEAYLIPLCYICVLVFLSTLIEEEILDCQC